MAGDAKGDNSAAATPKKAALNPLWLVDAGAGLGLVLFLAGWALAASPVLGLLREVGLLFIGCWVVVRALEVVLRHRDGRDEQRRELLRRLAVLNDALLELRKSLTRDSTRRFLDRRAEYAAGLKLARPSLAPEEAELAKGCGEFCDRMAKSLADTVHRRADVNAAVERLRREIDRAARRGDLDQHDADDMIDIIADAVSVLDEAIYAEWNADHFCRLTADQRHFARELDRYKSSAAGEIERRGRDLFDQLFVQVRQKVEVVDLILEWDEVYRKLETRLAGLYAPPPKSSSPKDKDKDKKDEKPKPRPSERFPMLVARDEEEDEDDGRRPRPGMRHRLPAAND
jgi:hypothetical protein